MEFKVNDKVIFVTDDDFNGTSGIIVDKVHSFLYQCLSHKYNKHYTFASMELKHNKEHLFSKLYETLKY